MTTEHEAKRPPAHFLTDTICDMLAFDGKSYTLSIEQQMSWDSRFGKLCGRHGDDKIVELLGVYFETGRLKKSTRPGEFADFVSRETGSNFGSPTTQGDAWNQAVLRCVQHATNASGAPEELVLRRITECHNDLQAAAIPPDLNDEVREGRKQSEWPGIRQVLVTHWGTDTVRRWREWRAESIEQVRTNGYRMPRLGGTG